MIKVRSISFFINVLIFSVGLGCPDSFTISPALSSQTCVYSFTFSNSTCTFIECRNKMSYSSPVQLMGWSQCFSECCSEVASELPAGSNSIDLLYSCESANAARRVKFIGILAGLSGFFVILTIVGLVCYLKESCPLNRWLGKTPEDRYSNNQKRLPFHSDNPVGRVAENITSAELTDDQKETTMSNVMATSSFYPAKTYFHSGLEKKNIGMMQAKCMVCLEEKPNCQLNCNHNFHSRCLGLWFERNPAIPCRDVNVKMVRVYCQHCLGALGVKTIHKFKKMFRKGEKSFRCEPCNYSSLK